MSDDGPVTATLDPERAAALRAAPYSYPWIGATADALPDGYRHLRRSRVLGRRDFENVAEELLTWQVHERAGLGMATSSARARAGEVALLRLGRARLRIDALCRVVYVIEEPDRAGFAYGTLPGHPESGEELFLLERHDHGVTFSITAFSRPVTRLSRLSGPVGRAVQDLITARYLRAAETASPGH